MAEGYKAWSGGQVLNAADLTDYASSQAVMRFANAAGRDAALTVSVVKEGMLAYLKDTNILTVNTDGTTTGWVQIYPVITSAITDSQVTNAKLAANAVSSSNIIDGTITGTDIAAGTITGANIQDASIGPSDLAAGTYGISITGNAATATNANYATSAGSANTANTAGSATSATTAYQATNATYATELTNGAGSSVSWSGGTLNIYANPTNAQYALYGNNGFFELGPVTGSSSTQYLVWRSTDGRYVTRSGTSLRDTKTEIQDIAGEDALEMILQLRPRTFRFRDEFVDQDDPASIYDLQVQKQYGLVVEEVLEVNPELIHHDMDKDGNTIPKMWKDNAIVSLLIGAVKNQQTQIDALVARLDALEASHAH